MYQMEFTVINVVNIMLSKCCNTLKNPFREIHFGRNKFMTH